MAKLEYLINVLYSGYYNVEKGESLKNIANAFQTTEREIILKNGIANESYSGVIKVKKHPLIYTVIPTDTIENIAEKFAVLPNNVLKTNDIGYIYPGQKLIIENE